MKVDDDKILHALVSAVSALVGSLITFFAGWYCLLCGGLFSLGLGLGKEYGDSKATGNQWDWGDILFDVIGIAIGVLTAFCIFKLGGRK